MFVCCLYHIYIAYLHSLAPASTVTFLVETCFADLTIKNGVGCTPLWVAAGYDRVECLEYLIERLSKETTSGEDFIDALLHANTSGDSPFLAAASKGNTAACKCLLENDIVNQRMDMKRMMLRTANKGGDTPLKVAVADGRGIDLITFLLKADEDIAKHDNIESKESIANQDNSIMIPSIHRKNGLGLTPLIVSCERNLATIAELLLEHGADAHSCDAKGRNPLAVGAFCGCNDVVQLLLSYIAVNPTCSSLLNETDDLGCTPLWLASRTGNLSMVKLLVEAGADATIKSNDGLTPHEVATKFKKEMVDEYFSNSTE